MNISDWPLDKIMQLPDHMFGRRFLISATVEIATGITGWDISDLAFPEMCVIWEYRAYCSKKTVTLVGVRMALGDQLPTTTAQMDALDPLFNGYGVQGAEPRRIPTDIYRSNELRNIRMPLAAGGRRLIIEFTQAEAGGNFYAVELVVSSVPKDIPECLILGRHQK